MGQGVTVTLYNLDGNHPVWQNNVQMAPKQMKIIESPNDEVVLSGYGEDAMGESFADYGLTINFKKTQVYNCVLHMHDRVVYIEYLPLQKKRVSNNFKSLTKLVRTNFLSHLTFLQY